ncbi:alpha/beta fold hydrolase [Agromyces seonyuensis]|uniref:Alpha/beta fold hydrolase n=1 Tax=Agromyces seonyuensis TaxID=2662446 RepID=A0A6I4NWN5_9MICO|nr:alpha/beta hydrolase [Agromyces seonyuensis]MWB98703.1 alpha/beta fold hydrolase [Agromyces seonyuensis]
MAIESQSAGSRPLRVPRPDGAVVAAEAIGDPGHPALVLVAGADCPMDWWRPEFCAAIAGLGLRVLRFDQRGTGETTLGPPGSRRDGLPVLLGDALAVLDAIEAADAHWYGFSAGGMAAQLAAVLHPERVRALTLQSTRPASPFDRDPDLPPPTERLWARWAEPAPEPDWTDASSVVEHRVENDRAYASTGFDEDYDRAIWTDAVRRSPGMHHDEAGAESEEPTPRWRERLADVRVPTAVLHGADDPLFPVSNGEALARGIPGATFTALPGIGHDLPPAVWPVVLDAIRRAES